MLKHETITERIISGYYRVYNTLGHGFLEKVYERALVIELRRQGLSVEPQAKIDVFYEGEQVGEYFADMLVESTVIVEIKAATGIATEHEAQLVNYLKATDIDVGLLLNFGTKPQFRRRVFDTARLRSDPCLDPSSSAVESASIRVPLDQST
jgi:GxxExxY protein